MNTEVGGGSRTLKSINTLITATLMCVVLGALAWVAAYMLEARHPLAVAGALAIAGLVPLFLMFRRVRAVDSRHRHREALSLRSARKPNAPAGHPALLDELAPLAMATSPCRPRSPKTSPARSPTPSTTPSACCATW